MGQLCQLQWKIEKNFKCTLNYKNRSVHFSLHHFHSGNIVHLINDIATNISVREWAIRNRGSQKFTEGFPSFWTFVDQQLILWCTLKKNLIKYSLCLKLSLVIKDLNAIFYCHSFFNGRDWKRSWSHYISKEAYKIGTIDLKRMWNRLCFLCYFTTSFAGRAPASITWIALIVWKKCVKALYSDWSHLMYKFTEKSFVALIPAWRMHYEFDIASLPSACLLSLLNSMVTGEVRRWGDKLHA